MKFVRKLLDRGILVSDGPYYELGEVFVERFEAFKQSFPRREAVLRTLQELDGDLDSDELSESCMFIETMMDGGEEP